MKDPKEIVRNGYNAISYRYRADDGTGLDSDYVGWLSNLIPLLANDAPVLELGCGCGIPVAKILASNYSYVGIDLSPVQGTRARRLVPDGHFINADMSAISFGAESFEAILSFYAIIHVPLEEQPRLFERIFYWLKPAGYLMATVGHTAWTGIEEDWLGAPMYWSHSDKFGYLRMLREVGFEMLWTRFIPEGDSGHTLLLARKKST